MASQSLYRKWRSQTFSDLIGQEAITRTLLNAVREGRVAHAYLFCGPRGTGKTSAARLLAKALNCERPRDGEPCNECVSCVEIATGRSPDVIEIDAASTNSVDDIRELRENVRLMGSGGHYKVYVIDEAHMLSTQAFNALLKTLEEPPPHVIFVLATTEAHKMLATVVSRCQRYDFRRIRMADIVARLQHVAQGEGLTLDPAAADLLGRAAQGGLRDALSLLDQAVALCGAHVTLEGARSMLGLADVGAVRRMIASVADDAAPAALDLLNELVTGGADLRQLNAQFAEEWRALMLARAGADVARVMDYTEDEAREVAALAARFSLDALMACARVFARNETPARGLPVPQLALEISLLECLSIHRQGVSGVSAVASTSATLAPASPEAPRKSASAPAPAPAAVARPAAEPARPAGELDLAAIDAGTWAGPQRATVAAPTQPATPAQHAEPPSARAEPAAPAGESYPADAGDGRDWVGDAQRNWPLIRKVCRQKPPMGPIANGFLSAADPVGVTLGDPPTLIIRAKFDVHLMKLREPAMREAVEWALEQALGAPLRVRFISANEAAPGAAPVRKASGSAGADAAASQAAAPARPQVYERVASDDRRDAAPTAPANGATPHGKGVVRERPARVTKSRAQLEQAAREDPVVQEFARILKAEVTEVRPLEPQDADDAGDAGDAGEA
ncbi:MAG TPA: DNA polymerase III subunit gamma/tau [Ktedonobacterales bacterium]|nr:DNA polymerase III subunit gamma/tau [Ktedonobacterales bacterium]